MSGYEYQYPGDDDKASMVGAVMQMADVLRSAYLSFVAAGFNDGQAMYLTVEMMKSIVLGGSGSGSVGEAA